MTMMTKVMMSIIDSDDDDDDGLGFFWPLSVFFCALIPCGWRVLPGRCAHQEWYVEMEDILSTLCRRLSLQVDGAALCRPCAGMRGPK